MYKIKLKNDKTFYCDESSTIFDAARNSGIFLEHSCLSVRCRSCIVRVSSGKFINKQEENILNDSEINDNYTLSCNAIPISDLELDLEDLNIEKLFEKKIIPAKISEITHLNQDILRLDLRIPPTSKFEFNPGQYVNIVKGDIKRSYSIADSKINVNRISFFIKNYSNGMMSNYLFNQAKVNDLLRIEGPIGSFFLRESDKKNIIFLATGTGIAPVKSIIESMLKNSNDFSNKIIWLFFGGRFINDIFWTPQSGEIDLRFIPVLSRDKENIKYEKGYVQDVLVRKKISLSDSQVYACGSQDMINSSRKLLLSNGLNESDFFSDAFTQSN